MKNGDFGLRFAAVVSSLALAPAAAMAYIDPGNGAYMVQALFTLVGAALFYVRHPIRTVKHFWRRYVGGLDSGGANTSSDGHNSAGAEKILTSPEATPSVSPRLGDGN
jgi:hypothetical protein